MYVQEQLVIIQDTIVPTIINTEYRYAESWVNSDPVTMDKLKQEIQKSQIDLRDAIVKSQKTDDTISHHRNQLAILEERLIWMEQSGQSDEAISLQKVAIERKRALVESLVYQGQTGLVEALLNVANRQIWTDEKYLSSIAAQVKVVKIDPGIQTVIPPSKPEDILWNPKDIPDPDLGRNPILNDDYDTEVKSQENLPSDLAPSDREQIVIIDPIPEAAPPVIKQREGGSLAKDRFIFLYGQSAWDNAPQKVKDIINRQMYPGDFTIPVIRDYLTQLVGNVEIDIIATPPDTMPTNGDPGAIYEVPDTSDPNNPIVGTGEIVIGSGNNNQNDIPAKSNFPKELTIPLALWGLKKLFF